MQQHFMPLTILLTVETNMRIMTQTVIISHLNVSYCLLLVAIVREHYAVRHKTLQQFIPLVTIGTSKNLSSRKTFFKIDQMHRVIKFKKKKHKRKGTKEVLINIMTIKS